MKKKTKKQMPWYIKYAILDWIVLSVFILFFWGYNCLTYFVIRHEEPVTCECVCREAGWVSISSKAGAIVYSCFSLSNGETVSIPFGMVQKEMSLDHPNQLAWLQGKELTVSYLPNWYITGGSALLSMSDHENTYIREEAVRAFYRKFIRYTRNWFLFSGAICLIPPILYFIISRLLKKRKKRLKKLKKLKKKKKQGTGDGSRPLKKSPDNGVLPQDMV